ncbi:chemotaxis protein CheA [Novosphingobium taihuense]|uniref:Chemotaxis protein CheA n=1 Tax=Novosphingobium taihuense TaxID=260085 RepID=A0A7W7AAF6_9SPHN|nr:chemotaxis protein CheA [Novosphingobium taihuense]MBB4613393.1 two-component system chemotaxis sensor kinase CheA [Novosphingobium taihuense]TWH80899.1 two-component system chemotaxis sensor kinase CheA [Novosphingobium taihuense]
MSGQDPIAAFRVEAGELLDATEQALLDLSHDLESRALIDTVFRGMHTLKGSGAMFGFDALAAFTHHCETTFDSVRKGLIPATAELVALTLAAMDHMRTLVDDRDGSSASAVGEDLLARLHALLGNAHASAATLSDGEEASRVGPAASCLGHQSWHVTFRLPSDALTNGTNPLILLDELRDLGGTNLAVDLSAVPPLDELDPTQCHLGWALDLPASVTREEIEDVFIFVIDDMELSIEAIGNQAEAVGTSGDALPASEDLPIKNSSQVVPVAEARGSPLSRPASESVRVPADRLDLLMDRVGELVIVQSRLAQLTSNGVSGPAGELALRSISEEVERLANELRDTMMVLRMVPIASLFGRFRRLVHDLARETGKSIELETDGESTEIDKTVSERLADPIVHLIRNSCDHGLETEEDRIAAGKSPSGRLRLSAQQAGGEVLITIEDDGRGISRERVRAKAEANGLIQPGQVLSDSELLQLIFQPGFSTASQITNLSGRGVGMDVVKRTIEGLRGNIDMTSEPGKGSVITLRIPLTLAIIDGLLVRVGNGKYVIPLAAVEECLELSLEEDIRSRGRSMIQLRERLVPFLRLRELFATGTRPDPYQKIVVIATGGERVGLVVDQIIGSHQTVIKSMSSLHRSIPSFSGATILGDGGVALILDVVQLVALGQSHEERLRAAG